VDLLLYIVRFLHYTSALQLFGVAVFQAWITSPKLQHAMSEVSGRVAIVSAAVLLVSGVAWLLIVAGSMGSGWADTVNPAVVGTVLRSTQFGQVWTWHLGIALLVLPAAAFAGRTRAGWSVLAILSALSLGGLGLIGHAATLDGSVGLLNRASHILHALSSGFWLGSLVPLIYTLGALVSPELGRDADIALRRFSGLGHGAVAIALGTGISNSWFILRHEEIDLTAPYQTLLLLKILLVGGMLVLALVNRYVFVPRIAAGPGLGLLRDGTIAEIVLSAVIIVLVSVLGMLSPS
jgi:putative copper resistance protein D